MDATSAGNGADQAMTARAVAGLTFLSQSHIYHLASLWQVGDRRDGLPCHRIGRSVRFFEQEVLAWLRDR